MIHSKKGSVFDALLVAVFIFALAIGFFLFNHVFTNVADTMLNNSIINASADANAVLQQSKTLADRTDYIVFLVLMIMAIGIMIASWFIPANTIFAFIFLIVDIIIVVISAVLSYVWGMVSQNETFLVTLTKFPITDHIMTYLPFYTMVICLLSLAVMYGKPNSGGMG